MTAAERERFNELCSERCATGVFEAPEGDLLLSVRPHGIFLRKRDRETGEVSLSFLAKLPKMPESLLEEIVGYFREDLSREAAVRVCYDEGDGSYFFVRAGGVRSGAFISYDYSDSVEEILREGVICVMDVHSHNRMGAFWSGVDDGDELWSPGALYGVIGKLDLENPSMLFRAVDEGTQVSVPVTDLFDLGTESPFLKKEEPDDWYENPFKEFGPEWDFDDLNVIERDGTAHAAYCGAYSLEEECVVETHRYGDVGESHTLSDVLNAFSEGAQEAITRGELVLFTSPLVNATDEELEKDFYVPGLNGTDEFLIWPGLADSGIISEGAWKGSAYRNVFLMGCVYLLEDHVGKRY